MSARPTRHRQAQVVLAYLCAGKVDSPFMGSVIELLQYDACHQGYLRFDKGGGVIHYQSSPVLGIARTEVVHDFVAPKAHGGIYGDAEWLFWLDSDATFEPNILENMMAVANAESIPILGALAFTGATPERMYPTVYRIARGEPTDQDPQPKFSTEVVFDYPRNALVQVGATGCHCILIHKSVFVLMYEHFKEMADGSPNPYPWYADGHVDPAGNRLGEDIIFCIRANALNLPVHVHTGIKAGHIKTIVLDEALYDRQEERRKATARTELLGHQIRDDTLAKKELVLP